MDKYKSTFPGVQKLFWLLLLTATATAALFETGILTRGTIAADATTRYFLDVAGVLLTIGLIPLALKRFSSATSAAKESDDATFAQTYCRESGIRLALLFAVTTTNIGLYYGTGNNGALYCALAGAALYIYSFPRKRTMQRMREE